MGDAQGSAVRDGDGTDAGETGGGYDDVARAGRDGSVERDASARGERQRTSQRGRGIDGDIVVGDERETVGAQRRQGRGYRNVTEARGVGRRNARGRTATGGADADIAREQAGPDLVRRDVPAGVGDGDVDRIKQPVAGAAEGRTRVDEQGTDVEDASGSLDATAVAAELTPARTDDARGLREGSVVMDVGPEDDFATLADATRGGVDERGRGHGDEARLRERAAALPLAADADAAAAELAVGEQRRMIEQRDGRRDDRDIATLPCRGGGVDEAALLHGVGSAEVNPAAVLRDTGGDDLAGIADDARGELVVGLGGDDDLTAGRAHDAAVVDERLHARRVDEQAGDAGGGIEVEADGFAGGEDDRARLGHDQAGVTDFGREERDVAAERAADRALVEDHTHRAVTAEVQSAGEEVRVGDRERRGDEGADVDARGRAEVDPLRVDEEDLAVGLDAAEDAAGVRADDAVEDRGRGRWLREPDGCITPDVEVLPIDDRAVGTLRDVERRRAGRARRRHRHLTRGHLSAARQRVRRRRRLRERRRHEERGREEHGAGQREAAARRLQTQ